MRPLFRRRRSHTPRAVLTSNHRGRVRRRDARHPRRAKDPDRVAGGYSASHPLLLFLLTMVNVQFSTQRQPSPTRTLPVRADSMQSMNSRPW